VEACPVNPRAADRPRPGRVEPWAPVFVLVGLLAPSAAEAIEAPRYLGPKPPKQVRRIVTLAPSITEIVLALGARERLVGVSRFDELPEAKALPRVGGFVDPSIEAILALRPDLVLVQPAPGNQRPVEKLAEIGTPVLALPMHTVAQTLASMREVGRALGRPARADELVRRIESTRARIRSMHPGGRPPRVLVVYEWEPLVVAGPGSFADELLRDAGGTNAADRAQTPFPVYPVEAAVASRADVVVDVAHDPRGADRYRALAGFSGARWVRVPSGDLMHPGPNLGRGLEELHRAIHGAPTDGGAAR
jgi:iron complex transport system substrate-binding protein